MSQVVRTTNDVITNSLYLLGELGVGETADSFMLSTGLELLNEVLDGLSADSIYIPYLTEIDFTMVVGQASYTISDMVTSDVSADQIVDLSFANYIVNNVANTNLNYPMRIINKAEYYGVVRQDGLVARPGFIFLNKQVLKSIVTVYPAPDQAYPCQLQVKCMLNKLVAQQNLSQLSPYYYGFLKYALGREFRSYYPSGNWSDTAEQKYQDYYETLKNANETDLTVRPSVILTAPEPFYWANILSY